MKNGAQDQRERKINMHNLIDAPVLRQVQYFGVALVVFIIFFASIVDLIKSIKVYKHTRKTINFNYIGWSNLKSKLFMCVISNEIYDAIYFRLKKERCKYSKEYVMASTLSILNNFMKLLMIMPYAINYTSLTDAFYKTFETHIMSNDEYELYIRFTIDNEVLKLYFAKEDNKYIHEIDIINIKLDKLPLPHTEDSYYHKAAYMRSMPAEMMYSLLESHKNTLRNFLYDEGSKSDNVSKMLITGINKIYECIPDKNDKDSYVLYLNHLDIVPDNDKDSNLLALAGALIKVILKEDEKKEITISGFKLVVKEKPIGKIIAIPVKFNLFPLLILLNTEQMYSIEALKSQLDKIQKINADFIDYFEGRN